jgi:glycosyltransferase involved in cell wall biosynthesis
MNLQKITVDEVIKKLKTRWQQQQQLITRQRPSPQIATTQPPQIIPKKNILHITHHYGGGTDVYINNVIKNNPNYNYYVLKTTNLFFNNRVISTLDFNNVDACKKVLEDLNLDIIHINFLKNYPEVIIKLILDLRRPYIITVHDYSFIFDTCHTTQQEIDSKKPINPIYSALYTDLFNNSKSNMAPSEHTASIYSTYYPTAKFTCVPHEIITFNNKYLVPDMAGRIMTVGIIGTITKDKGCDVICRAAKYCKLSNTPIRFKIYGCTMGIEKRFKKTIHTLPITQTGPYQGESDLFRLMSIDSPDMIWIPNLILETYSYTLTSAMKTGLCILLPDTKVFRDRTLLYTNKSFIDNTKYTDLIVQEMIAIRNKLIKTGNKLTFDCVTVVPTKISYNTYHD